MFRESACGKESSVYLRPQQRPQSDPHSFVNSKGLLFQFSR
jgi:hypothetical protein